MSQTFRKKPNRIYFLKYVGDGIVAQWAKPPLKKLTSQIKVQVPISASHLLIQFPVDAPGKAAEDAARS